MGVEGLTKQTSRYYQPYSLRVHHLLFVSAIALLLLGFLQIGLQTLPHATPTSFSAGSKSQATLEARHNLERQVTADTAPTLLLTTLQTIPPSISQDTLFTSASPSISVISIAGPSTPTIPNVGAAPPAQYVATAKVTTLTPVVITPLAVSLSPSSVVPVPAPPVTPTSPSYVPTVGAAAPSVYVDTARTSTLTPIPITPLFDSVPLRSQTVVTGAQSSIAPNNQLDVIATGGQNSISPISGSQANKNAPFTLTPSPNIAISSGGLQSGSITNKVNTDFRVSTSVQVMQTIISGPSGLRTILTSITMVHSATFTSPTPPSASAKADLNDLSTRPAAGGQIITMTWPLWKVFVGGYLPLLLAVIFRVLWADIYANVKLIEPFTQLARPGGAMIADAASLYYLSTSLIPEQFISLAKGHWMMFLASATYISTAALSPLTSEVLFLDTHYCANPDPNSPENPCWPPQLSINPTIAKLTQALLCIIAVLTCGLAWFLRCRTTKLRADPSTIAGVAMLMQQPEILNDFRRIDGRASIEDIQYALASRRYALTEYQDDMGQMHTELIPLWDQIQQQNNELAGQLPPRRPNPHPFVAWCHLNIDLLLDLWLLCFLLSALIVITTYINVQDNSGFNQFFNSNSFGPRFIMSSVGTVIALNFRRLEREAHTIAPYRSLYHSECTAGSTILLKRPATPWIAFPYMLSHRHFLPAAIAFAAMLAEALIIALAGVPYSPGQVYMELLVCGYLSVTILCIMIISIVGLLVWRRGIPSLSRWPDTLLAAMSFATDLRVSRGDGLDQHSLFAGKYRFVELKDPNGGSRWTIKD